MAEPTQDGVKIYSRHDCPGCALTQRSLERNGVAFEVIDLSERPDLIESLRREGLRSLPVIETADGVKTAGFRPDRIKAIIAAAMPPATTTRQTRPQVNTDPQARPPAKQASTSSERHGRGLGA